MTSADTATANISSDAMAIAWPNASEPGWPSNRIDGDGHRRVVRTNDEERRAELTQ